MAKEIIELTDEKFLEAIKTAGLDKSFQAYIQKIGDKRTNEGIETFKKNLEKKDLSDKERLEAVEAELKELKDKTAKENTKILVEAELEKQNLSKGLAKYINSNDPSLITESVTNLKEDLLKIKQAENDSKLKGDPPPVKGEPGNGGDQTLKNYVENKNSGKVAGNPFQGKLEEQKKGE